jgi:CheY-like chemotaxis protein
MRTESLLLCRDADAVRTLRRLLDDVGIQVFVCAQAAEASSALARRQFDAVIVDCDDVAGALGVVPQLRQADSNRSAIVFAIVNGSTTVRAAFDMGANFVLDKPLSPERVQRSFRAAHGLMVRESRRYFRDQVSLLVTLQIAGTQHKATIINLSEGGIAVRSADKLPESSSVRASFTLPNGRQIDARGPIAWNTGNRAGIRLLFMSEAHRTDLIAWLNRAMQTREPLPIFINASRGGLTRPRER